MHYYINYKCNLIFFHIAALNYFWVLRQIRKTLYEVKKKKKKKENPSLIQCFIRTHIHTHTHTHAHIHNTK